MPTIQVFDDIHEVSQEVFDIHEIVKKYLKHIIWSDNAMDTLHRAYYWSRNLKWLEGHLKGLREDIHRHKGNFQNCNSNNKQFWKDTLKEDFKYRRFLLALLAYRTGNKELMR